MPGSRSRVFLRGVAKDEEDSLPECLRNRKARAPSGKDSLASAVRSLGFDEGEHSRCEKNIHQRQLEKEIPSQFHELVIAETGKRPSNPDK